MLLRRRPLSFSSSFHRRCSESRDFCPRSAPQAKNWVGRLSGLDSSAITMVRPDQSSNNEERTQIYERIHEGNVIGSHDAMQHPSMAVPSPSYESEFPSLLESVYLNRRIGIMKPKVDISPRTLDSPRDYTAPLQHEMTTGVDSLTSRTRNKMKTRVGISPMAVDLSQPHRYTHSCDLHISSDAESGATELQEMSLPTQFGKRSLASTGMHHTQSRTHPNKGRCCSGNSSRPQGSQKMKPFDLWESSFSGSASNHRVVKKNVTDGVWEILRPGMVLLKNYIPLDDQVKMVRTCRDLGLGEGGFYQPGFDNGPKLHLQMMCLGYDWDPWTRKYEKMRHLDGARPPAIPKDFIALTEKAIEAAHGLIEEDSSKGRAIDILPPLHPNICIVNFYNTSGRLGLHQDKDESEESLQKRLPVVSISLGDSAEFLYGDHRDVEKAEKITLESGDVLIFGGNSRHIFHGVASIVPDSAPAAFQRASKLRPGRLNLTFREF